MQENTQTQEEGKPDLEETLNIARGIENLESNLEANSKLNKNKEDLIKDFAIKLNKVIEDIQLIKSKMGMETDNQGQASEEAGTPVSIQAPQQQAQDPASQLLQMLASQQQPQQQQ